MFRLRHVIKTVTVFSYLTVSEASNKFCNDPMIILRKILLYGIRFITFMFLVINIIHTHWKILNSYFYSYNSTPICVWTYPQVKYKGLQMCCIIYEVDRSCVTYLCYTKLKFIKQTVLLYECIENMNCWKNIPQRTIICVLFQPCLYLGMPLESFWNLRPAVFELDWSCFFRIKHSISISEKLSLMCFINGIHGWHMALSNSVAW